MTEMLLQVRVKPRAQTSSLVQEPDGTWLAHLKAPPVDGKANKELIALIAEHFHCRKADVTIKSGGAGRVKYVRLEFP
jgi:hypothetical protein